MTQRVVNYTYGTGNPVLPNGSIDVRDGIDNLQSLDVFTNAPEDTYNQRDGEIVRTVSGMNNEFDAMIGGMNSEFDGQIINMGFTRVGTFASGATLTNPRQTLLWDIADGGDGQEYGWSGAFPKVVPANSTPDSTGGISVGAWISRFDPELRIQVREVQRRSYAESGYNLVAGSFEAGGTLVNANDVLLHEVSGKAYSGAGPFPQVVVAGTNPASAPGFTSKHNAITVQFESTQDMIASKTLITGQKARTGSTVWKIVSGSQGWPLDNGIQYAIPLNGVWVEDSGADSTGESDSYAAIMYVINKYNANTRGKFAVCFGGGHYKTSGPIALHALTSDINLNFGGAVLEATADMSSLISCPAITGFRLKGVIVQHSVGVTITDAMIHINTESGNGNKTTRHIFDDISAGLITGAPKLLLCDKMWESEIRRIRADRDVAGMTGELVELRSCVNCTVQPCELGYCAVAWRLSKNQNVSYGCEGVTFNGGVTAYAKIPLAGDNCTAIRLNGMVMDFCESSGPTFTNGQDVTLVGCWIANVETSNGWNGIISQPTFTGVKVLGCNFVNNSSNQASCGSINSPDSVFAGNNSKGCTPGFRYDGGVQEYGNQHSVKGAGFNYFRGASLRFQADAGIAPANAMSSGVTASSGGQLLQRLALNAPLLNAANSAELDILQGGASDQPIAMLGWNGSHKFELNLVSGDIGILTPGRGIRLTSPNGSVTRTLRLSDGGVIELI